MPNSVRNNERDPVIDVSNALYRRAAELIPAGTQTLAKGVTNFVNGVAPKFLQRGKGARVWDVDGNEYLDLCMGVGPISLGYCDPDVDAAISAQLQEGITFSLPHPLEVEVAELVRDCVPNAEMVRFSKTGADVTSAAVRLARAYTGRNKVLCCGYHGWHDWYVAVTDRDRGVPDAVRDLSYTFEYNDLSGLAAVLDDDVACVLLEPVTFQAPAPGFLQGLRALCDRHGCLLIFDEMWTGFRIALGGSQQYFGVDADLCAFSKALANGMPLSVLCGRREVMQLLDRDVFFFTTFGGEALSLAAARATINKLRERRVPQHIAELGTKVSQGLTRLTHELDLPYVKPQGLPYRTLVAFDPSAGDPLLQKSFVQQELLRRGVLWSGFHHLSLAHTEEDIDYLLDCYREVLSALRDAVKARTLAQQLRGSKLEPVFRRTSKFDTRPKPRVT